MPPLQPPARQLKRAVWKGPDRNMHRNPERPMSPHLTIWKWGPHMLVSILTRITGFGLAVVGGVLFVWWLMAAAGGPEAYDGFRDLLTVESGALNIAGYVLGIGLTWAFFQHALSGLRHFVMDMGAGYELSANKFWASATVLGALLLTGLLWAWILLGRAS
jgi:succinate dehydrogenase / fumarate reductase cytochrome b subunit